MNLLIRTEFGGSEEIKVALEGSMTNQKQSLKAQK